MEFAINWVFRAGPGVWSLFIFVWIASTLGHLAFNHLRKEEKLLNTFKYGAFALAYVVLATGGEIANREDGRAMLPLVFHIWGAVIWILSDWTSLAIYNAATHKRGSRGWLTDAVLGLRMAGELVRKRIWKGGRWPITVVTLIIVVLFFNGCGVQRLNPTMQATIDARASEMAASAMANPPSIPTPSPTAAPTSSITEATPGPGPVEVGTPANRPPAVGDFAIRQGTFSPYWDWNVRKCPGCDILPNNGLAAYHTYPVQGMSIEADKSIWLCQVAVRDLQGAEYCGPAMLYQTSGGDPSGVLIWDER